MKGFNNLPIAATGMVLIVVLNAAAGFSQWQYWSGKNGNWRDGSKTSAIETAYGEHHPLQDDSVSLWTMFNYVVFKEGKSGLHIGLNDWLYIDEEIQPARNETGQVKAAFELMQLVKHKTSVAGTELIVAVLPAKWRVLPHFLGSSQVDPEVEQRRDLLLNYLSRENIRKVDGNEVMQPLAEQAFLKTDTHWTPKGAMTVASALGDKIKKQFSDLPLHQSRFTLESEGLVTHKGDLLNYLPLGGWQKFGPEPDQLESLYLHEVSNNAQQQSDLFGEQDFPVVLVGTSYSANDKWHFNNALKVELGLDILNMSQEGKGPIAPMLEYLDSQIFADSPPELIIWEFPERYLGAIDHISLLNDINNAERRF